MAENLTENLAENMTQKEKRGGSKTLYIVVPCFNEQDVIAQSAAALTSKLVQLIERGMVSDRSRVFFVDDGSKDETWSIIREMADKAAADSATGLGADATPVGTGMSARLITGIRLSANRGHQNALMAGMEEAVKYCDAVITIDADLQDDIDAIDEFIVKYHEGADIVYGVRGSRKADSAFKRGTARLYYRLMRIMGAEIIYDHADFRLMSRRAVMALAEFKEANLFLRGLVPMLGFASDTVTYERKPRLAGHSKYTFTRMLSLAFEGITSFSVRPLRMISVLGFGIFIVSIVMLLYSFWSRFFGEETVRGWASLIVSIWALGGLQLFAVGVVGEYIGKIYLETKHRPRYIVWETLEQGDE